MHSLGQRIYRTGDVEVDLSQRAVRCNGDSQSPRPRTFDLLVYLIEHRTRVVSRDELLQNLWPETTVTSNSLTQCVNEARKLLNDDPREPRFIRTVSKSGYQFIGAVDEVGGYLEEVTTLQMEYEELPSVPALPPPASVPVRKLLWIAVGIAVIVFAAWRWTRPVEQTGAVIVIPFENSSTSADLDWLREGLPDMLITNLGRAPGMHVLGREQVRTLLAPADSGKAPFDRAIAWGREHRAEIVISGSFARLGDKIRVAAQVYRTRDASLLNSESFTADRPEQILTHMDLASVKLAAQLGHPMKREDQLAGLSTLMTPSIEAYRYYSLGLEKADALHPSEAIELFRKASELDPNFAMAHARIGYTYTSSWGRPEEAKPSLEKAFRLSDKLTIPDRLHIAAWYALANHDYPAAIRAYQSLIENNPRDVEAYTRLGSLLSGERRNAEAISTLQQALLLDPNSAVTWNVLSGVQTRTGSGEQAVIAAQRYVALVPSEPNAWDTLGLAFHVAGRIGESEQAYLRALSLKPNFDLSVIHLANLAYQTGRYNEAIRRCEQYREGAVSPAEKSRGNACLAMVYMRLRQSSAAFEAARLAVESDPSNNIPAAWIALDLGDAKRAAQLAQTQPNGNERGHRIAGRGRFVLAGRIAMSEGRSEEAIAQFRHALEENAPIYNAEWLEDCLADTYFSLGRYLEAVAEYQRVLAKLPSMSMARYHLAVTYDKLGKRDLARAEYKQFLDAWKNADPGIAEVAEASKRLQ